MHSPEELAIVQSVSLTSALERQLERLIVGGELKPGDRLNEIQLAARFGTSRGPLREATRSLEAKGFVEVVRNRGVFVRRLSLEDACEIYELRGALFGLAGRLMAQRMSPEVLDGLQALVERMEAAAADGEFEAYYPLNLEFHDAIMDGSGNGMLRAEYHRLVNKMHLFRAKSLTQGGGLAVSNTEHRDILDALRRRDPDRASEACWRHVERARHRMVSALERNSD